VKEVNPDFVTVLGSLAPGKRTVCRMTWDRIKDDYGVAESHEIEVGLADEAASKWAEREELEYRP